jgi:hypothetical protein
MLTGGLAKVSVDTGALFLSLDTPYDRDVLFEYLQGVARAHRSVRLEVRERHWVVTERAGGPGRCAGCGRAIGHGSLQYAVEHTTHCGRCARRMVHDLEQAAG